MAQERSSEGESGASGAEIGSVIFASFFGKDCSPYAAFAPKVAIRAQPVISSAACHFERSLSFRAQPVISSAARNLSAKTQISPRCRSSK